MDYIGCRAETVEMRWMPPALVQTTAAFQNQAGTHVTYKAFHLLSRHHFYTAPAITLRNIVPGIVTCRSKVKLKSQFLSLIFRT
jgi:hypothetical protein